MKKNTYEKNTYKKKYLYEKTLMKKNLFIYFKKIIMTSYKSLLFFFTN